jgi:hypothetical protein
MGGFREKVGYIEMVVTMGGFSRWWVASAGGGWLQQVVGGFSRWSVASAGDGRLQSDRWLQ